MFAARLSGFLMGSWGEGAEEVGTTQPQNESRDLLTCVNVAVFASVLRGDDGSHVCSAQGGEAAELPVQTGDVTGVGHHLRTRDTRAQIPPE